MSYFMRDEIIKSAVAFYFISRWRNQPIVFNGGLAKKYVGCQRVIVYAAHTILAVEKEYLSPSSITNEY